MLYGGAAGYVQWADGAPYSLDMYPDNTKIMMNSDTGLNWNWAPSYGNNAKPLCEKKLGK